MFESCVGTPVDVTIIPMNEMQPGQIGMVIAHKDSEGGKYNGRIVMRTLNTAHFEVMTLYPNPNKNNYWANERATLPVQLMPKGFKITLTVI